jgi:polyphosphate glucokinase
MNVLTIDIGGTNIKILATGQKTPRKFPSGPTLTPPKMVAAVRELAEDWKFPPFKWTTSCWAEAMPKT